MTTNRMATNEEEISRREQIARQREIERGKQIATDLLWRIGTLLFYALIIGGGDLFAAQMILLLFGSFHVLVGFSVAITIVLVIELIVSLGTCIGTKLAG